MPPLQVSCITRDTVSLRRLLCDTAAVSSINVLRLIVQVLTVPVLARLLSPTDYGLVGMALPFMIFAMIVADAGIGISLIRTPVSDKEVWSTCFWLLTCMGIALAACIALLAPLASFLFDQPRLKPMIMTLALVVLAQAIVTVPAAILQQRRRFQMIAGIEIAAIITSIGAAIVLAYAGWGPWARIGQQVVFFAVRLVATWVCAPFRPMMTCDLQKARAHLIFGGHLLGSNLVSFATRSLDNLVIGKVLVRLLSVCIPLHFNSSVFR